MVRQALVEWDQPLSLKQKLRRGSWAHFRNRQLLAYRTYPHFGMEPPLPVVMVLSFEFAISRKTTGS